MKPPKSKMAELAPNATGGEKSHAETAESAEFKMTELGPMPVDWEVERLGEIWSSFKTGPFGSSLHAQDYVENGTPLINPMHIQDGKIEPSPDMTVDDATKQRLSAYKLSQDDIIIGRRGEMGRAALVGEKEIGWLCGTGCFFLHLNESCCPSYIALCLRTPASVAALEGEAVGTTLVNLNRKILSELKLTLPPLAEQRRIARALSDVDELISALGKLIEKKRNIKTGMMQELLTGKTRLPGFGNSETQRHEGAEFKMTELGPIPADWEVKRLGEVVNILDNRRVPLSESQRKSGTFPYCGANGIVDYIDRYEFDEEAVLIAEDGGNFADFATRPIAYKMCGKYWVNNHAHVLTVKARCDLDYLLSHLSHKDITDIISGGTRAKLTRAQLENIIISLPPLAEQRAIATVLSDMDAEIAALEADRTKYESIKQGMMQELLTGKTRLKGE